MNNIGNFAYYKKESVRCIFLTATELLISYNQLDYDYVTRSALHH